ncbi:hypothetical protein LY76DRAFT_427896 [Colletotrichum caudatum]|nr:hypothetical protein LY76DRAFT_427896 [Colletotrichum caudatum]
MSALGNPREREGETWETHQEEPPTKEQDAGRGGPPFLSSQARTGGRDTSWNGRYTHSPVDRQAEGLISRWRAADGVHGRTGTPASLPYPSRHAVAELLCTFIMRGTRGGDGRGKKIPIFLRVASRVSGLERWSRTPSSRERGRGGDAGCLVHDGWRLFGRRVSSMAPPWFRCPGRHGRADACTPHSCTKFG